MLLKSLLSMISSLISLTTDKLSIKQSDKKIVIPICRLYSSADEVTLTFSIDSGPESIMRLVQIEPMKMESGQELANLEIGIPQKVSLVPQEKVEINVEINVECDIKNATFTFKEAEFALLRIKSEILPFCALATLVAVPV